MFTIPTLYRTLPSRRMEEVFADFDRLIQAASGGATSVPVSVWSDDESVAVMAEVPGVAKEDLSIEATVDTLAISGGRKATTAEGTWLSRERQTNEFARTISLPWRIDPDKVEARLADGMLTVALRRAESDKPRKVSVAV